MNTSIIVILYHPTDSILTCFDSLGLSFPVLLVDNTPAVERKEEIQAKNATYIPLNENRGIAYAQNIGIARALEQGAEHMILLEVTDLHGVVINKAVSRVVR